MKKLYLSFIFIIFNFLGFGSWSVIKIEPSIFTDIFKFYLFIFISTIPLCYLLVKKRKLYSLNNILKHKNNEIKKNNFDINYYFIIIFFIAFINFLTFDPNNFFLDVYHDGFVLTPSINFLITKSFWNSSYIESGLYPNFKSLIFYILFNKVTIGSTYFLTYLIIFLNKALLLFLSLLIVKELEFDNKTKIIFFIFLSTFVIGLSTFYDTTYFSERHFLFLLFINLLFTNFFSKKKLWFHINSFFLSLISIFSIFWWFDIFLFINLILLLYLLILYKFEYFFKIKIILINIFYSIIIFFLIFPKNEFNYFLNNLYSILFEFNESTFLQYPIPLEFSDGRAIKTLFFFSYSIYLFFFIFFKKKFFISCKLKSFFLIMLTSSIINYTFALGRSDSYHIINASGMLLFNLILLHLLILFNINKLKNFINYKKNFIFIKFFLIIFFFFSEINFNQIKNVNKFKSNIKNFILADDSYFFRGKNFDYIQLITYYNNIIDNNDCVQIFTDETIIPYLLKKKTCSKYFFYHILSEERLQLNLISDLKKKLPKYILYDSDIFNYFNFSKELPLLQNFIFSKYVFDKKFLHWTFYKLKNY